ncbi:MAG: DUF4382 domain-containing protein [Anaeromyxobacter sp.]
MTIKDKLSLGAIALAFLVLAAACGQGAFGPDGRGQVAIVLSSDGAPSVLASNEESRCGGLQAARVTISSLLARSSDGVLVEVAIDLPYRVDLLSLGGGREVTLPDGFLPPGTYDQFVVVIRTVELVLGDGTGIAITPPGGGWTSIVRVAEPFTVAEGQTTTVALRFRRDLSFGCGDGGWDFHPRFDCDGERDHHEDRDD